MILRPPSTVRREFENAALFLRLGLPSTLIRHETKASRKRSSKFKQMLKPLALHFSADRKHFNVISLLAISSLTTNPK